MEILSPLSSVSNAQTAFVILPGKQVTLHAKGLAGSDKVYVEILELSKAPDFTGNPCCTFYKTDIQVIARTPLLCPNGEAATLTATYPVGTLDAPQAVTLGVRVEADDAAVVSIELYETESTGCMSCICERPIAPCTDTTWVATGDERCVGTNVERKEESNCGNVRWVVDRVQTWTATGDERCVGTNVEREEVNDCGKTRWVVDHVQTWTATGDERCVGTNVERKEESNCGNVRWTVDRAQTWTATGDTRCVNFVVEQEEVNDCGKTRWAATATTCGYCPSLRLSCDGQNQGYGYHVDDPKDPAATVEMAPCAGDTSIDSAWIYPTSGPGHTVKVVDCDGTVIGYAANVSNCASDCGC